MKRASGVLLHVSSLPSDYGIGSLGMEAFRFIDKLQQAKQSYWQILPLTETDSENSPYASQSAYAGNFLLIDVDLLIDEGYISDSEARVFKLNDDSEYVNFTHIKENKFNLLNRCYKNKKNDVINSHDYIEFINQEKFWLDDYALYACIKQRYNQPWYKWENSLKYRDDIAINNFINENTDNINYFKFIQYLFYHQWKNLKKYAEAKNIQIIGDIPMYVSYDSADVWANPEQFSLNDDLSQKMVAGVPPDYFSEDGQLWGNPIYNWVAMKKDGYKWWLNRIKHCEKLYDVLRIDHFRAIDEYWEISSEMKTAKIGEWIKGPGIEFIEILKNKLSHLKLIAEDLGVNTLSLTSLLEQSEFPGMKVIEFAFDDINPENSFLPHNFCHNTVAYLGTHDNDTIIGWWNKLNPDIKNFVYNYTGFENEHEINRKFMKLLSRSSADTVIFTMQDILGKNSDFRMNLPGTVSPRNWAYKLKNYEFNDDDINYLKTITIMYSRNR